MGAADVADILDRACHALEIGRVGDIGGIFPGKELALVRLEVVPVVLAAVHVVITLHVLFGRQEIRHGVGNFLLAGPDIPQKDRVALRVLREGLLVQVDVHATGDGVGHHQGRGGQVVHAHLGMYAALEVAVAREHGCRDQVVLFDRRGDRPGQGTRVPDAGGTAIADVMEAEFLEIFHDPGIFQVLGDHARAGGQ